MFSRKFRDMCIKIYELDSEKFLSAPGIAQQAAFKTTAAKLKLATDIDVLLIVEKELEQ